MRTTKDNLPNAKIWFQSILPIHPNGSRYISRNVIKMNNLIYEMCSRFKIFNLNVFHVFLNHRGNVNSNLFHGYDVAKKLFDIHPNKKVWEFLQDSIYILFTRNGLTLLVIKS